MSHSVSLQMSTKYNYRVIGCVFLVAWPCCLLRLMEMKWTLFVELYVQRSKLKTCLVALAVTFPLVEGVSHISNLSIMLADPPPEIGNYLFSDSTMTSDRDSTSASHGSISVLG